MKYNKGFAPLVLIAIIIGVLAIGGGTYYFGIKSKNKNVPISQEINLPAKNVEIEKTIVEPTKNNPSVQIDNNNQKITNIDCGNDINCLIKNVDNCNPSMMTWISKNNLDNSFDLTSTQKLTISGFDSLKKCIFFMRTDDISLSFTVKAEADAKAKGETDDQIKKQLQKSSENFKSSIGSNTKCSFTTNYLNKLLLNWSKNDFNSSADFSTVGNCTSVDATGKSILLQ